MKILNALYPSYVANRLPFFILVGLLVFGLSANGQSEDPLNLAPSSDTVAPHSVRKATLRSTLIPGWGQLYNKKWWKVPIVYAGLGTTVFFVIDNHNNYQLYLGAFESRLDDNPNNDLFPLLNERQLIQIQDTFRRWRDLSIIVGALIYALNILDAHVDAHLYDFDVSDNLNASLQPALWNQSGSYASGFALTLQF